ncbi:MAG TPA: aquaporin [Candidatus Limnocylindrales bacterium]|jgi:MIP family channel proteins
MRNRWNPIFAELIGTFLFFFIGIGAVRIGALQGWDPADPAGLIVVALAHGVVLAVLVSALAAVSGAHFNPAVTFGVWVAGQIPGRHATQYVIAQLIGGLLAAWSLLVVFPGQPASVGLPALGAGVDPLVGLGVEAVLTVVLLIAVFGTAIDPRAPKVGGLAIGLAVAVDILMGGPLTGAAMNPARWFGPAGVAQVWDNGLVWIVGPLLGAALAALLYRFLLLPEADMDRTPAEPEG